MNFTRATANRVLYVIVITLLLIWILFKPSGILGVLDKFLSIIAPFVIGCCIAFVLNEALTTTEKGWDYILKKSASRFKDKLKRPVCLLLSFIVVIAAITMVFLIIIPELKATTLIFTKALPGYMDQLEAWFYSFMDYLASKGIVIPDNAINFDLIKDKFASGLLSGSAAFLGSTITATTSVIGVIVNVVLALVFSIFLLASKERLKSQFIRLMRAALPDKANGRIMHILRVTRRAFSNYVNGQLIEAIIIGVLCFIGMIILKLPYASAISILVGFTALIPMFGAFIGTAIGAFLILFIDPMKALWFIIFIIILQQLEGNLIYPKVVGKSVGLPGIWVLAAVTLGASTFGLVGMIISVPTVSTIYELTREFVRKKEGRI